MPEPSLSGPENASPAEELRYRLRQQQLSSEYAVFALRHHDLQALLQEATRICAEGLQSKMCKVMQYLPEEHQFVVQAGVGWKPGVVGHARVGADTESPTGYAFQTGNAVISNHLHAESRFRTPALLAEHGIKRAINTVIRSGSERFGVLEVDSPVEGRFTEADAVFVAGFANLIGVAIERQNAEDRLVQKEALLGEALAHQKVLTKEISHQVKNSLAIVAGLLAMQSRATHNVEVKQALTDAQNRVRAIGKVHDRLWRQTEALEVDLADFITELCEAISESAVNYTILCDIEPIRLSTDQAISLGLIANEGVTNALKYAYPEGAGIVHVTLSRVSPEELCLEIRDEGVGLPNDVISSKPTSGLGKKVILSLGQQLGGSVKWQSAKPGTRLIVRFTQV